MLNSKLVIVPLTLILAVSIVACGRSSAQADKVTLQLNYSHSTEFIGYYVALDKGFYRDANIEVTLKEGGQNAPAWQSIIDGSAQFAIASFDEQQTMLKAKQPSMAVMAMFQIPPLVMFALADSGIKEVKDLVGKRIAIKSAGWGVLVNETLSNAGIDPSSVIEVNVSPDAQQMLYDRKVDVWTGFATDEAVQAEIAGYKVNNIYLGEYGVGGYEGLLITNQQTIAQNADLVSRFTRASQKGLQYALEHPDEAAQIMVKWQPNESLAYFKLAIRTLVPLVDIPQSQIGSINAARWGQLMGPSYSVNNPGYTMQFLQGT